MSNTSSSSATFTVAFQGDNWSFFRDGSVPDGWTVWESGMTWEAAHDAIEATSSSSSTAPSPVWVGEYRGCAYWEFPGLRGMWNQTMNSPALTTPGYEWRHEPLTLHETQQLEAAARACGMLRE